MNVKKIWIIGFVFFLILFLAGTFSAQETSYCCEKTINGAWCQNAPEEQCSNNFKKAATSCESTSYCKLGTCVNSQEGTCMENTPQIVCENNNGIWYNQLSDEIPQCQLGCCLIGEQASYTTQTRCKRLSSLYGLETNYRADIQNEFQCITSATSEVVGACVFEKENEKTCKMLTQKECKAIQTPGTEETGLFGNLFGGGTEEVATVTFHDGYLCSATILGTNCGPKGGTACVEGKDEVYFLDTCGNLANVYDYSKTNDENYWTYIQEPTCDDAAGNKDSVTCGNCDYYAGSTCQSYRESNSPAPNYGEYICVNLDCKDADFKEKYGRNPQHGEAWCATNTKKGVDENLPGSESFRMLCYNGEVSVEQCDARRATVCVESEVEGFKNAVCRANVWQDCVNQETEEECLNIEKRDCKWIEGYSILKDDEGKETKLENEEGKSVEASCVPNYAPGFDFWEEETDAGDICSIGNYYCVVEYEYNLLSFLTKGKLKENNEKKRENCVKNCRCIPDYEKGDSKKCEEGCESHEEFLESTQNICGSLGDCGVSVNYFGKEGYNDKFAVEFGDII